MEIANVYVYHRRTQSYTVSSILIVESVWRYHRSYCKWEYDEVVRLQRSWSNISRYGLYEKSEVFDIPINAPQQLYH
jgi:hypothetical protein